MKDLKKKVSEFVEIAKECPENMQSICFEVLLKNYLGVVNPTPVPKGEIKPKKDEDGDKDDDTTKEEKHQDDISDKDIHVKVKKFMKGNSVTLENLNQLLYKEGDEFKPLYDDLKSTKASESQIRIALLQCLYTALENGEFGSSVESVRDEAKERKCLDQANFSANFKNNSQLFDFKKFDRKVKDFKLSENRKKELANIILELL